MKNLNHLSCKTFVLALIIGFSGCSDVQDAPESKVEKVQVEKEKRVDAPSHEKSQNKLTSKNSLTPEEEKQIMIDALTGSKGMENQFIKMKHDMPKMVKVLKFGRGCLSTSETKEDAKECMNKIDAMAKENGMTEGDGENEDFLWTPATKHQMLKEINKSIHDIEKTLPCVEKALNMADLMNCNKLLED